MKTLMTMMVRDLQDMAGAADAGKHQRVWRARFYHRLLRLVRWSDKTGERELAPEDGALAVYTMGSAVLRMREIRDEARTPPDVARAIDASLARIKNIASHPERALPALDALSRRLARNGAGEADLVSAAGSALRDNLPFFKLAAL